MRKRIKVLTIAICFILLCGLFSKNICSEPEITYKVITTAQLDSLLKNNEISLGRSIVVSAYNLSGTFDAKAVYKWKEAEQYILTYDSDIDTNKAYESINKIYDAYINEKVEIKSHSVVEAQNVAVDDYIYSDAGYTDENKLKYCDLYGKIETVSGEDTTIIGSINDKIYDRMVENNIIKEKTKICIIDGGFDKDYALDNNVTGKLTTSIFYKDFSGENNNIDADNDPSHHGTDVSYVAMNGILGFELNSIKAKEYEYNSNKIFRPYDFYMYDVFDYDGNSVGSLQLAKILQKAIDEKMDVINLSLGIVNKNCEKYNFFDKQIEECKKKNIVVVCAAGNVTDGIKEVKYSYPANNPDVITVSSAIYFENEEYKVEPYALNGTEVDYYIGGECTIGSYIMCGTSYSAPQITAMFAELRRLYPKKNVAQLMAVFNRACVGKRIMPNKIKYLYSEFNKKIVPYTKTLDDYKSTGILKMPAKVVVYKKVKVKKITLSSKKKIKVGKRIKIRATINPKNASNKKVKWSVSNKKWAKITSKGVFTAKKAGRGKTVTVKCMATDGSKKTAKIRIKIIK